METASGSQVCQTITHSLVTGEQWHFRLMGKRARRRRAGQVRICATSERTTWLVPSKAASFKRRRMFPQPVSVPWSFPFHGQRSTTSQGKRVCSVCVTTTTRKTTLKESKRIVSFGRPTGSKQKRIDVRFGGRAMKRCDRLFD